MFGHGVPVIPGPVIPTGAACKAAERRNLVFGTGRLYGGIEPRSLRSLRSVGMTMRGAVGRDDGAGIRRCQEMSWFEI